MLSFDIENGIERLGTIDHDTEITRAVQIGGKLVVTSSQKVTAHDPRNPEVVIATTDLDNQSIPSLGELPVEPPMGSHLDPIRPPPRRDTSTQANFVETSSDKTTAGAPKGQNLEGPSSRDQGPPDTEETLQLEAIAVVFASEAPLTPQGSSHAPEANPVTTASRISDQTERTHSDVSTEPDDPAVNHETHSLLLSLASDLSSSSDASEDDELFSQP